MRVLLSSVVLSLVGCGETADPTTPDSGSPPTDTSATTPPQTDTDSPSTPTDPVPCDPATGTSAAVVSETQVVAAYPTPAGGPLVDGVYDLQRFEVYAPAEADGNQRANRIVIAGDVFTSVNVDVDDGGSVTVSGGTWASASAELALDVTCPAAGGAASVPYTVSLDELWIFDPSEPNVQVYVRQ